MADSVVSGHLMMAYWSNFSRPTALENINSRAEGGGRFSKNLGAWHEMSIFALPRLVTS
jgi:hypothetical protein